MFKVMGLDHIVLNTSKIDDMLRFYCDVLGCTIERTVDSIKLTQLRAGDSLIDIMEIEPNQTIHTKNVDHFCLRIDNFDTEKLQAYFKKHDIAVEEPTTRYGAQGSGISIYLNDPENNKVELRANID